MLGTPYSAFYMLLYSAIVALLLNPCSFCTDDQSMSVFCPFSLYHPHDGSILAWHRGIDIMRRGLTETQCIPGMKMPFVAANIYSEVQNSRGIVEIQRRKCRSSSGYQVVSVSLRMSGFADTTSIGGGYSVVDSCDAVIDLVTPLIFQGFCGD